MSQTTPEGGRLLALQGIGKHYGGITALADVTFDVGEGEVVSLVGDNGAGKSTLVKIMSGIVGNDGGRITWDGAEVRLDKPQDANDLGIQTVYQDLALCDNLDTVANLFLGREIYSPWWQGRRQKRADMEKLARVSLGDLNVKIRDYSAPVGSLSGGQRQSVAVARAVLSDPRIVILDEPTAALGVPQRAEVLALIERLRDQGHGVILISHDLADVIQVSDRVIVMRLGRKVAEYSRGGYTRDELVSAITGISTQPASTEHVAQEQS